MTEDTLLGIELGSYRIERKIAAGGMGAVYLGIQPAIGSRVAIKVLSDRCAADPALVERFFSEARAVNLIRHEAIVNVLDMAQLPDGRPYLVMEYLDGQTLGHLARRIHLPLGGLARCVGEALAALAAAHAIGIVHRDLKPDNILVSAKGHAKILDFGIAKLARGLAHEHAPRTYTDDFMGTPAYMSPEQIASPNAVDARSDIYAMGIVLYEAVTGRAPFIGSTFEIMRAHVGESAVPPSTYRPDLPPAYEAVIMTAIAKDPAHRFANAGAMGVALAGAARDLPAEQQVSLSMVEDPAPRAPQVDTPVAPSVAPPRVEPPPRRRWLWLAPLPVIAGVVVASIMLRTEGRMRTLQRPIVIERPARFDIEAFLPSMVALAKREAPDAQLVEIRLHPLAARGLIDLTRAEPGDNYVRFVSKTKPCLIEIAIGVRRVTVSRRDDACAQKPVRLPTCRLATLDEASMSSYLDDVTQQIDAIPGMPLAIGSTTEVRYVAGKRVGRWILSGMASDEVDDDCGNSDRDEP